MKFYKLPTGLLASTQAEVKESGFKLAEAPVEEVPTTDKAKMQAYLNAILGPAGLRNATITTVRPDGPAVSVLSDVSSGVEPPFKPTIERRVLVPDTPMSAAATLAAVEGVAKGLEPDAVDKIIRTILTSDRYMLARFAKAVAIAFDRLGS